MARLTRPSLWAMRTWPTLWIMLLMLKNTDTEARLDVLQAAVLALCAALPPERATFAKRMFSAALADLEDQPGLHAGGDVDVDADVDADADTDTDVDTDTDTDALAAGMVASILRTLER